MKENLECLLKNEAIAYIDYLLAIRLDPTCSDTAFFIAFLSKSSREGHLCVSVNENEITPTPHEAFNKNQIVQGSKAIDHLPIIQVGTFFYFQKNWKRESLFMENFQRIKKMEPFYKVTPEISENLLPEQKSALIKACENSFTIITGGPGTGKTFTAGEIIKAFWKGLTLEDQSKVKIALAAPTGKAASNLQNSIHRAIPEICCQAQTLHSLLGIKKRNTPVILGADLILVDECSMIDALIMSELLNSIKAGARLIFLGDPYQLPPVESGNLFSDMIDLCPEHVVHLKTCLRSDLKGILDFADAVNQGKDKEALQILNSNAGGISFIPFPDSTLRFSQKALLEYACPFFNHYDTFRILSPLRQGPYGVNELNALFENYFRKNTHPFSAPIIITSNDPQLELFNGETGVLYHYPNEPEYALFQTPKGPRKIPAILLPTYEYAYALSVHKSQGSEFDHILLLLPEGSEHFGRQVLYTAATRARTRLEIISTPDILTRTITTLTHRLSGLSKVNSCFTHQDPNRPVHEQ